MQCETSFFIIVPMMLLYATGCGQPATYGIADGGSSWTSSTDDAIPGIDEASVSIITLKAGSPRGVPFVVWSDLPNGRSGSGGGRAGGASYSGSHRATDGRRIEFHAETTDGKTGTITIAGGRYNLTEGSLFLISTQRDLPDVAQVAVDTTDFPKDKARLIELAASTDAIRTFFERYKTHDQSEE